jgi:hypothetical protein
MTTRVSKPWRVIATLALAGCRSGEPAGADGAIAGEARALSEAAEMIASGRPATPSPSASGSEASREAAD